MTSSDASHENVNRRSFLKVSAGVGAGAAAAAVTGEGGESESAAAAVLARPVKELSIGSRR